MTRLRGETDILLAIALVATLWPTTLFFTWAVLQ